MVRCYPIQECLPFKRSCFSRPVLVFRKQDRWAGGHLTSNIPPMLSKRFGFKHLKKKQQQRNILLWHGGALGTCSMVARCSVSGGDYRLFLPAPPPPSRTWGQSYLSPAILLRRGSSQPGWHSQWESMKTRTSPVALVAPSIRAPMAPSLLLLLSNFTPSSLATYSLREDLSCPGINRVVVSGVTDAAAIEIMMTCL